MIAKTNRGNKKQDSACSQALFNIQLLPFATVQYEKYMSPKDPIAFHVHMTQSHVTI